jgi:hypothetical protein
VARPRRSVRNKGIAAGVSPTSISEALQAVRQAWRQRRQTVLVALAADFDDAQGVTLSIQLVDR